ncbi:MAG: hypothetical protein K2W78_15140 [Xanthobacteraceae bacterium]|nr:hypothetical protein [Xanthobacteraceae bacterium]
MRFEDAVDIDDVFDLNYLAEKLKRGIALDEEELQVVVHVLQRGPVPLPKSQQIQVRRKCIAHYVATLTGTGMQQKRAIGETMDEFSVSRTTVTDAMAANIDLYRKQRDAVREIRRAGRESKPRQHVRTRFQFLSNDVAPRLVPT